MGKRGPKPKNNIPTTWSSNLAYAVGLLASDGCLYKDKRHIAFVSKDVEQILNFKTCLGIKLLPGKTFSGYDKNESYRLQFGSVLFYQFLVSIGLSSAKSKTIGSITVPDEFFFDFLRGSFDGDGCFYSYMDPRWKASHMFYIEFVSASKDHVEWLRSMLYLLINVKGHITKASKSKVYQLKYAKKEGLEIIKKMYYSQDVVCLSRKRQKIERALSIEMK